MRATIRHDLANDIEIPITYWHNREVDYAKIYNAEVIYQYDENLSNPYGLVDGQVLMHHPNWGLFIADSIDFDFEGS